MPRAVITGAAGFLGSHLCRALLDRGWTVVGVDNFLTSPPHSLDGIAHHRDFTFVEADVCDYLHIPGDVDAVLHFASPASPRDYLEYPIHTLKVGSQGTHVTLGLARAKGARYLLASTSEVYGDPLKTPQSEDYWGNVNPVGPRGVYDEAKRYAEALAMAYHRTHGVDVKIARIFNTYGPGMREHDGRAIPTFLRQAAANEPITIFGDGSQTRSFCYVDDEVEGLLALLESSWNGPMNIGNPEEYSIGDLAQIVLEVTGSLSTIVHEPLPVDDPRIRRPDASTAARELRWQASVSLRDGITRTWDWYRTTHLVGAVPQAAAGS